MISEELDLHELIDECIESSMPLARGKQLKLEKNVPLELPPLSSGTFFSRSEEHTSELQSLAYLVCRLLLEKKKKSQKRPRTRFSTTRISEQPARNRDR